MHACIFTLLEPLVIMGVMLTSLNIRAENPRTFASCHVAQLQCHARSGCQMALNNFFIHCHSVIKDELLTTCPTDCKHALVSLLSTEDETGLAFINCDCDKEEMCVARKKRVEICQREVLDSMHVLREDAQPISCNLARWICEADTSCLAALQYYYDHCSRLFSGLRCTSKCRNSLEILSRQPHASKLRSCRCDGSEDYDCHALKINTEALCFHRNRKRGKKDRHNVGRISNDSSGSAAGRKQMAGRGGRRSKRRKRRNQAQHWKKAQRSRRRGMRRRRTRRRKRQKDA